MIWSSLKKKKKKVDAMNTENVLYRIGVENKKGNKIQNAICIKSNPNDQALLS